MCSLRLVNKQEQLQRDGLPEGIYLVQFMNEAGIMYTERLVVVN